MTSITERPLLDFMRLSIDNVAWAAPLSSVHIDRGGKRNGATQTVAPGTLTCTLVNAGDPLTPDTGFGEGPFGLLPFGGGPDGIITPNMPIVLRAEIGEGITIQFAIFSGTVNDVAVAYTLDKQTNRYTTHTTITAVDAVSPLVNTTRYGVLIEGGEQSETWAQRVNRLALSAPAGVEVTPADETQEIKVYAL